MSDKETAPWMREAAKEIWRRFAATFPEVEPASEIGFDKPIAQIIAKHAEERTAQAPTQLPTKPIDDPSILAGGIPDDEDVDAMVDEIYKLRTPQLCVERETDGRWIAEFTRFPGVMAYGSTEEEAIRNAAKVLIEATPQGTPETTGLFPPNSSKNWQKEK